MKSKAPLMVTADGFRFGALAGSVLPGDRTSGRSWRIVDGKKPLQFVRRNSVDEQVRLPGLNAGQKDAAATIALGTSAASAIVVAISCPFTTTPLVMTKSSIWFATTPLLAVTSRMNCPVPLQFTV